MHLGRSARAGSSPPGSSAPQRHRRTGAHARHLQARRQIPAHPADPWRADRAQQQQGTARGALRLAERRPVNVATVALANKMARTIWALLAHERDYQADYVRGAADTGRDQPTLEVATNRVRKARQGVMAHRSDRDPPNLTWPSGQKPVRRVRRGSADPSGPAGKALHQQAGYRAAPWPPDTPNQPLPQGGVI